MEVYSVEKATTFVKSGLTAGCHIFAVTASDEAGNESTLSGIGQKSISNIVANPDSRAIPEDALEIIIDIITNDTDVDNTNADLILVGAVPPLSTWVLPYSLLVEGLSAIHQEKTCLGQIPLTISSRLLMAGPRQGP